MPFEIKGDILASYDAIQKILNVTEPKRLVFGNYPDRYFYAVPDGNFDITQVAMFGKGTITWLIPDGVAYSVGEFEFDGVQQDGYQTITIQNNGTEWADVDYEITHQHENGFIGLVSQYGVIQLGKRTEKITKRPKNCLTVIACFRMITATLTKIRKTPRKERSKYGTLLDTM